MEAREITERKGLEERDEVGAHLHRQVLNLTLADMWTIGIEAPTHFASAVDAVFPANRTLAESTEEMRSDVRATSMNQVLFVCYRT